MNYDKDKVDDAALALLHLTLHDGCRAWKGLDWDAMDRLHEKGMIHDPKGKAKSIVLTEEGLKRCEELFTKFFCTKETRSDANDLQRFVRRFVHGEFNASFRSGLGASGSGDQSKRR
jgi:hypothetical protein